ncbi:MAG: glycosyltransferase family 2 protein, partial [Muribaculaceae bacterium]|nr:glycosyltransferase family 2 protein [Muribaculaceae bacterium]
MSRIPISVCIIAKNEETHIGECLKRLQPCGFEIVVADTGSTDLTKQTASQYADKVVDFTWTDDFSAARNFCARHAANNQILALDCDEYVEHCNSVSLVSQMRSYPKLVGALQIKSIVRHSDGMTSYTKENVLRFYDRRYFEYSGAIHEQIVSRRGSRTVPGRNFLLPVDVIHHGYALPAEQMRIKQERNLRILYHEYGIKGASSYLCFQIGQSELVLENCEKAIAFYEEGLSLTEDFRALYVHSMVEGLAKAYVMSGREQDALALMERYEPQCESARYVFYHANVLMDNHEPLRALVKYVKATMMPDTDMLGNELLYCYKHIIELYH